MTRLTQQERERLAERARDPEGFAGREAEAEAERVLDRRLWASVVLTTDPEVCASILRGLPVIARQLDAEALRRALRGRAFPPPGAYVHIDAEMLDAVAEGGPFNPKARHKR